MIRRFRDKLKAMRLYTASLFMQGLTPNQLSLSMTLGILIGILPLFGVATIAVTAIAIYLRINLPLAVFMSYVVTPIHLILFIPFIRLGEWITASTPSQLTLQALIQTFEQDYWDALTFMVGQLSCGVLGWGVAGIPGAVIFYFIAKLMLGRRR